MKIPEKTNFLELRREVILFFKRIYFLIGKSKLNRSLVLPVKKIGLEENFNGNLLFLLEKAGAFIFEKEIGETIDIYSLWTEDERLYIMLESEKNQRKEGISI